MGNIERRETSVSAVKRVMVAIIRPRVYVTTSIPF